MNAKQGRGLGVQPPGRADIMAITTLRYSGDKRADGGELKKEKKCSRTRVDIWPNKRLAQQVVSNPLTPLTLA